MPHTSSCSLFLAFLAATLATACSQPPSSVKLEKQWETDTSIRTPESALWDAQQQIFYISDINGDGSAKDGNGFISKLGADGKVQQLHWVDGLDAPKGLGMHGNELYVADLDSLVIIDIAAGQIRTKLYAPGATFLNDVTVDGQGNVYTSDSRKGRIYRYKDDSISVYLERPETKGVNGLLAWHGKLWMLTSGGIYQYDEESGKLALFSAGVKGGDGLAAVDDSDMIASRWQGEVYYVKNDGTTKKLLDTKDEHKNTADICYVADRQLLVIPTFNGNVVMGYKLQR